MRKLITTLSILALSIALMPNSYAATATQNINANAQLQASCVMNISDFAIGWFKPSPSGTYNYHSSVSVRCTKNTAYVISLNTGNGTYAQRFMKHETTNEPLNYQLYTSSYNGKVVGDGSAGTVTYTGTSQGNLEFLDLVAVLNNAQYVSLGKYSDTLTATITY